MLDPDKYLQQLNECLEKVQFIEIGAMDGKSFDLLHGFIVRGNWKGVLVEPLKDLFHKLVANYSGVGDLQFENSAIAEVQGTKSIFRIPPDVVNKGLVPGWAIGISSFYEDRNALGGMQALFREQKMQPGVFERLKPHIIKEDVNCITMQQLVEKFNVQKVGVLQIDTEGYDYQVFKQFDFSKFKPYFIKIEVGNLPQHEYAEVQRILNANDYDFELRDFDIYAQKALPRKY